MKYIKTYEDRRFKEPKEHNPKHKYDCEKCKFNWCCGFECSCQLHDKPEAPDESLYKDIKKYNL